VTALALALLVLVAGARAAWKACDVVDGILAMRRRG
jgi:hypothetical protein